MDMQVRYEKLLADAAECALLRDLATDSAKRELFDRLSEHLTVLASLMERAVGLQKAEHIHSSTASLTAQPPAGHAHMR
jgi:hypothetical protein